MPATKLLSSEIPLLVASCIQGRNCSCLRSRTTHEVRNEGVEELILLCGGKLAPNRTQGPEEMTKPAGGRAKKAAQERGGRNRQSKRRTRLPWEKRACPRRRLWAAGKTGGSRSLPE